MDRIQQDAKLIAQELTSAGKGAGVAKDSTDEFMRLLDSLEVRVDLMAQMQQTTKQIKARTMAVNDMELMQENVDDCGQYAEGVEASCNVDDEQVGFVGEDEAQQLRNHLEQLIAGLQQAHEELENERETSQQLREDQAAISEAAGQTEARLARENSELWGQVGQQRECIRSLNTEIERLREQSQGGGGGDEVEELCRQLAEERALRLEAENEVLALRQQLLEERHLRENAWQDARFSSSASAVSGLSCGAAALPTMLVPGPSSFPLDNFLPTVVPEVAPFNSEFCGANLTLSDGGYTATRTRGCRQSVLVGTQPLPRQEAGCYFEVEVRETVEGWVGGLGVGVTRTGPGQLRRVPDKAWRMPQTFIVGYWGCVFLDGKERRTRWRADALQAGSKVGVLAATDGSGDLHVFVDGALVVTAEGALLDNPTGSSELYPVVDVFAATLAVTLLPAATPPKQPWERTAAGLSPPGSPGDGQSMLSTTMSQSTL